MSYCPQLLTPQEELYLVAKEIAEQARSLFYASYNDALCQPEIKLTRAQLAYAIRNFDYYYEYSDDNSVYKAGKRMEEIITSHSKYPELSDLVNLVRPYHTGDEEVRKVIVDILTQEGLIVSNVPDITDKYLLDESVQSLWDRYTNGALPVRKVFVDYLGKDNVPSDVILRYWKVMMTYGSIIEDILRYIAPFPHRHEPFKLHTSFAPNFVENSDGIKRPFITLALPKELQEKVELFNDEAFVSCFGILEELNNVLTSVSYPRELELLNGCRFRKIKGILYLICSRHNYAAVFSTLEDSDNYGNFKVPVKPYNSYIRKIPASYWLK